MDAILDAINASSTPSTTTDDENDEVHNTLINQTITISDIIEALTIIKNNNVSTSCPQNPNGNGQNAGPANSNGSKLIYSFCTANRVEIKYNNIMMIIIRIA